MSFLLPFHHHNLVCLFFYSVGFGCLSKVTLTKCFRISANFALNRTKSFFFAKKRYLEPRIVVRLRQLVLLAPSQTWRFTGPYQHVSGRFLASIPASKADEEEQLNYSLASNSFNCFLLFWSRCVIF